MSNLISDPEFQQLSLPFLFYFSILIPSAVVCFSSSLTRIAHAKSKLLPLFLLVAAVLSFSITWFYIFKWFIRDATEYMTEHAEEGIKGWMRNCDLFTGAYKLVTEDAENWWWSVKLLNFVPSMVVFMFMAEFELGLPAAVFLALGMLGAISLCWPLFLIQYIKEASLLLWVCMVLSVLSNVVQPFLVAGSKGFDFNLKAIHVLLLAPLLLKSIVSRNAGSINHLYAFLAGSSFVSFTTLTLQQLQLHAFDFQATAATLVNAFFSNECQSSITTDYISSTVTSMVFMLYQIIFFKKGKGAEMKLGLKLGLIVLVFSTPILSNGVVFPLVMIALNTE
ncbi:hypothetical protein BCR33DRAFT_721914 [Rhizoclosmatium globosum]|uniref:Uncharacterized protein n=1 Tax=Rhizoclosmatium globosum TaxID=329046 RepID=A0A1Y2BQ07_9FUNG|nr:hypothetical protein BCR33DRAFT_721914 [Rhizoclosmatium globosum]|eukprot:ORY36697.1 hypothetical protein BCR33DRAFT_721914 [Rhizoclosmatium globosum]